ncbi:hypothetical protein ACFPRL_23380 [Pseudoclavibacter helvolus]
MHARCTAVRILANRRRRRRRIRLAVPRSPRLYVAVRLQDLRDKRNNLRRFGIRDPTHSVGRIDELSKLHERVRKRRKIAQLRHHPADSAARRDRRQLRPPLELVLLDAVQQHDGGDPQGGVRQRP